MDNVSLFAAFVAGVLSFISPCVLPLIPGYLSFVSGVTVEEMRGTGDAGAGRSRSGIPRSCGDASRLCAATGWAPRINWEQSTDDLWYSLARGSTPRDSVKGPL